MKSLLSFITLIRLATCLIYPHNSSLDPGKITWPKDTWINNPIELSQTNAGSSITMTFNIRPSTSFTAGTIELIFPSSFSSSTQVTVGGDYNFLANKDTSFTYSTTLPSASSVYGPFGIITRNRLTGKILDANYNFGCIYVSSSVATSSLIVVRVARSTDTTINTENTLEFQFILNFSLWAHDIIEIVPDTTNGNSWVLKAGPICKSLGDSNPLLGSDSTNNLPCFIGKRSSSMTGVSNKPDATVTSGSIYIYGISSDTYVSSNSYTIKIDISSITSPGFVTSLSSWIVNIWRFGTNRLLARYATSAGPGSTAGTATFLSWKPQNYPTNPVVVGQVLFTKISVATSNPLPASSIIFVIFTNIDIHNTIWWSEADGSNSVRSQCYITPAIDGASCSIFDMTTAVIAFAKAQAKGSVSFVVLSYFIGSNPWVVKITTYYGPDTSSAVIDQSEINPGSFSIQSTSSTLYKIPDVALHNLESPTTYPQLVVNSSPDPNSFLSVYNLNQGGDLTKDIFIRFTPGGVSTFGGGSGVSANVVLYFPRTNSFEFNNFGSVYIDDAVWKNDYITPLSAIYTTDLSIASTTNPITVGWSIDNQISLGFSLATDSLDNTKYYILRWENSGRVCLPFIASNKGTFYEIWAIANYKVSTTDKSFVV